MVDLLPTAQTERVVVSRRNVNKTLGKLTPAECQLPKIKDSYVLRAWGLDAEMNTNALDNVSSESKIADNEETCTLKHL